MLEPHRNWWAAARESVPPDTSPSLGRDADPAGSLVVADMDALRRMSRPIRAARWVPERGGRAPGFVGWTLSRRG